MVARRTTVTRKGQVTIPIEIRRRLGIKEGDKLAVEEHHGEIVFKRALSYAERTAGIGAAYRLRTPLTVEEEKEAFGRAVAEEVVEQMRNE